MQQTLVPATAISLYQLRVLGALSQMLVGVVVVVAVIVGKAAVTADGVLVLAYGVGCAGGADDMYLVFV